MTDGQDRPLLVAAAVRLGFRPTTPAATAAAGADTLELWEDDNHYTLTIGQHHTTLAMNGQPHPDADLNPRRLAEIVHGDTPA